MKPKKSTQSISEMCPIDEAPHNFLEAESSPGWVYCTKCTKTVELIFDDVDPEPPDPPDPSDAIVFNATGGDDTWTLQELFNGLYDGSVVDIRGFAGINSNGVTLASLADVTIMSSDGGGFRAITSGEYRTPYSSMVYGTELTACTFENLKFDGNGNNAQGIFLNHSDQCRVLHCEVWNIRHIPGVGVPYAAIKADSCTDVEIAYNHIHDLSGQDGDSGVRGIWAGVGGSYSIRPRIHDNTVENPGHSGIVTESSGPIVNNNKVIGATIQGSGYKFIARGDQNEANFDYNYIDGSANGGFMIEGSDVDPSQIYVRGWKAKNVGKDGTSFGFLYVSGGQGTSNVRVEGCDLDRCKRIANLNNSSNFEFTDISVKNGEAIVELENNVHNVTLSNAGAVNIGNDVSEIYVDGEQVA